jgi:hypothetical protein
MHTGKAGTAYPHDSFRLSFLLGAYNKSCLGTLLSVDAVRITTAFDEAEIEV